MAELSILSHPCTPLDRPQDQGGHLASLGCAEQPVTFQVCLKKHELGHVESVSLGDFETKNMEGIITS